MYKTSRDIVVKQKSKIIFHSTRIEKQHKPIPPPPGGEGVSDTVTAIAVLFLEGASPKTTSITIYSVPF
jgi:hypothetical protein